VRKKTNAQKSHAHFEAQCAKNQIFRKAMLTWKHSAQKTNAQKSHAHFEAHCAKKQIFRKATHTLKHIVQKIKYSEKPCTL